MGFLLDPNDHTVQLYSITSLTNPLNSMIIAEGVSCWDIIDSRCTRYLNFEVIEATCLRKYFEVQVVGQGDAKMLQFRNHR